jgi:2-(1,2-epoxy-1,2-dihydrophenyl)acetyl-CoA isomerase
VSDSGFGYGLFLSVHQSSELRTSSTGSTSVSLDLDGAVAIATLNRPQLFNALDLDMARELGNMARTAAARPDLRVLVLRGAGKAFCGGGDIHAMQRHADDLPRFIAQMIDAFHDFILAMARLPLPVVAAVHGAAAGGGFSIALTADVVLAARSARFVVAYPQLGTSTDGGLSFRLQQRLGPARALAVLTLSGPLSAHAAQDLGLVHAVVDDNALQAEAMHTARQLAALPAAAVRELRGLVQAPSLDALQAHLAREREAFLRCAATAEFAQRVAAFAERGAG